MNLIVASSEADFFFFNRFFGKYQSLSPASGEVECTKMHRGLVGGRDRLSVKLTKGINTHRAKFPNSSFTKIKN